MAPSSPKIDVEWASSLIGLRMRVPDHWWVGHDGKSMHDGKLASFDVEEQKWILIVDAEPDNHYPMSYSAVCECVHHEASTHNDHNLPFQLVIAGMEEDVAIGNKTHAITDKSQWKNIEENDNNIARVTEPVPWTGKSEDFTVNATPEEIESFKDQTGEISHEKILMWSLPKQKKKNHLNGKQEE